jgi:hypothetical protein
MADEVITKRRVTMTSYIATPVGFDTHLAVDYVGPELIDAYVADASLRWQLVEVSVDLDAGPGGFYGDTIVPAHLEGVPSFPVVVPNDSDPTAATPESLANPTPDQAPDATPVEPAPADATVTPDPNAVN